MVTIRTATKSDIPAIDSLLLASQLPAGGAKESVANFFVAEDKGKLVGVGGLENCGGNVGLLRSFAVLPEYRNQGIAKQLYEQVIAHARQSGISNLYLLTTTAQDYFARFGFAAIARSKAPEAIRNTQQFRELCPDSAVLMSLSAKSGCGGCTTATGPSLTADPESNQTRARDQNPGIRLLIAELDEAGLIDIPERFHRGHRQPCPEHRTAPAKHVPLRLVA
jgi:amino-acid N-acetyltransferase